MGTLPELLSGLTEGALDPKSRVPARPRLHRQPEEKHLDFSFSLTSCVV